MQNTMGLCESILASTTAIEYLIELGHTKIAYVGETKNEERYTGYVSTLRKHNIPLRNEFVSNVILSSEGGYCGTKTLLKRTQEMTAIFCPNDLTAIGVMRALQEAGLRIPTDISVISVDVSTWPSTFLLPCLRPSTFLWMKWDRLRRRSDRPHPRWTSSSHENFSALLSGCT